MNAASLLTLLALALALAVQPWSVVAAVLLTASQNGTRRALAFAFGWFLALAVVAVAAVVLAPPDGTSSSTSTALSAFDVAVGLLLAGWLVVRVRRGRRSGAGATEEPPKWMARIDTMPALAAFALGAFLPTYVLVVSAMSQLLQAGLSGGALAAAALLFVVVASLGVFAPLLVLVARRDRAPEIHAQWRTWLIANSSAIMTWILGAIAVVLVLKGIAGLLT